MLYLEWIWLEALAALPARERERRLIEFAAEICLPAFVPEETSEEALVRLAGYLAAVSRGRAGDDAVCEENLVRTIRACRDWLATRPAVTVASHDPAQRRWGSPHAIDLGKLRSELPVTLLRLVRRSRREGSSAGEARS